MRDKIWKTWVMILLNFLISIPAFAAFRNLTVVNVIDCTYDLDAGFSATINFTFQQRNNAAEPYFITFGLGANSTSYTPRTLIRTGNSLEYNLYTDASMTNILMAGSSSSSNTITGIATNGTGTWVTFTRSYFLHIPANQWVPYYAQTYTDTNIPVALYPRAWQNPPGGGAVTDTFRINCTVPAVTTVCLVATGGDFDDTPSTFLMDFGVLSTGELLACDLKARSNYTRFRLYAQSTNSQVMVHTNPLITDTIPYTFSFNSTVYNLSGGGQVMILQYVGVTTVTGVTYPMRIDIGAVGTQAAGYYGDDLTFTIVSY